MTSPSRPDGLVHIGRITGLFGVKGWVKVYSHARPREAIVNFSPWLVETGGDWREYKVEEGRTQGKGVVVKLENVKDRDEAARLIGADVSIKISQLPPPSRGEYYWAQLVGLEVITLAGTKLGRVDHLVETGANDVLVVRNGKERWLPAVSSVICDVDLESGVIRVEWDADF